MNDRKRSITTPQRLLRLALRSLALLCAAICGAGEFSNPAKLRAPDNDVLSGADPHVEVQGRIAWAYPTRGGQAFYAFASEDMKNWYRHGPIFKLSDASWAVAAGLTGKGAWAPGVVQRNGKWYLYYSIGPIPSSIGVAVADGPAGPFVDSGAPLLQDRSSPKFEAIDAMVFKDPVSQKYYFYAGGSWGSALRVFEMNDDMVSFKKEIPVTTPTNFTEGAFMHYRNGIYYLSYSHGVYLNSTYSVHYATSSTPTGPWTYRGAILTSNETRKGPGHHSFFKSPIDGGDLIAYHCYDGVTGNGPYEGSRRVAIDRFYYNADGTIRPIVMTKNGVQDNFTTDAHHHVRALSNNYALDANNAPVTSGFQYPAPTVTGNTLAITFTPWRPYEYTYEVQQSLDSRTWKTIKTIKPKHVTGAPVTVESPDKTGTTPNQSLRLLITPQ